MIDTLKALSDESRLRIVNLLLKDELCVCEIEYLLKMTQTNVSRHLNKLKYSGVVEQHKTAQWVRCRISEKFTNENVDLIDYLKRKMQALQCCIEDTENYEKYKASKTTREQVRKLMRDE